MSEYSQAIRVFVMGCPSNIPVARKLMDRLIQVAYDYDVLEAQRDQLLETCKQLLEYMPAYYSASGPIISNAKAVIAATGK